MGSGAQPVGGSWRERSGVDVGLWPLGATGVRALA